MFHFSISKNSNGSMPVCGCFVTGADTDAGKTTAAAALALALELKGVQTAVIKPVQTGCFRKNGELIAPDVEACKEALRSGNFNPESAMALHCFEPACSPFHAAERCGKELKANSIAREIKAIMSKGKFAIVEGAGGLLAPLNAEETMLDLMKLLDLPILLTASDKLGCINHTLSAMSILAATPLRKAGAILSGATGNETEISRESGEYLAQNASKYGFPFLDKLTHCPQLQSASESVRARGWLSLAAAFAASAEKIFIFCSGKSSDENIEALDKARVWHPYASAAPAPKTFEVERARGSRIHLADGRSLIDGMSSWWCASLGYGRKDLCEALSRQAGCLAHVMFGGFAHKPAARLADVLVKITPPGLDRVFFVDSGSVAVEVALKMAVQHQQARGKTDKKRICSLRGAYHGDTMWAMSVCDPVSGMHHIFKDILPQQIFLEKPESRFDEAPGKEELIKLERTLRLHAKELAALIVEPIVQGAGGMWFYSPLYLKKLRQLCDELDILLIADEIATGFGRTGKLFACEWAQITPDIICVGKSLTGGFISLAAAIAKEKIAAAISRPKSMEQPGILLHGPTFMANPLACAVASQAVETLLAFPWAENVSRIEARLKEGLEPCRKLPGVADVRVLGAIGVVETEEIVGTEKLQEFFVSQGVWIRPFSRMIYLMPPFITPNDEIDKLTGAVVLACEKGLHFPG